MKTENFQEKVSINEAANIGSEVFMKENTVKEKMANSTPKEEMLNSVANPKKGAAAQEYMELETAVEAETTKSDNRNNTGEGGKVTTQSEQNRKNSRIRKEQNKKLTNPMSKRCHFV